MRDVAEDWSLGRVYLPQDELSRFGVERGRDRRRRVPAPAGGALMEHQAGPRGRAHAQGPRAPPAARPAQRALRAHASRGSTAACSCRCGPAATTSSASRHSLSTVEKMRGGRGAVRVAVVGGGLAGLAAALELTKQGHDVTPLRGAADARRRGADPAGARGRPEPAARQRPARRARLLHGVPRLHRARSARPASLRRVRLGLPVDRRGRKRCDASAPGSSGSCATGTSAWASGLRSGASRASSRSSTPAPTTTRRSAPCSGRSASRRRASTASGTSSSGPRSTLGRTR